MNRGSRVRRALVVAACVALAVGAAIQLPAIAFAGDGPPPSAPPGAARVFELAVKDGRVVGADTLRARRGDRLELRWSSDKPITLHLHGYDVEVSAAPGSPGAMSFKADLPGRFPVSEHGRTAGHHRALLYIEIHP